jgi:hypothetical protein
MWDEKSTSVERSVCCLGRPNALGFIPGSQRRLLHTGGVLLCSSRRCGSWVAIVEHDGGRITAARARIPSDTAKFPLRFNGGFWGCFVRMGVESIQPPKPFQAEYEGSIPFTRSNLLKGFQRPLGSMLKDRAASFQQMFPFWLGLLDDFHEHWRTYRRPIWT